jgi:hypothetical protein
MVGRVPHPFSRILRKGWGITIDWEGQDFSPAVRTKTTEGAPSLLLAKVGTTTFSIITA